MLSQLTAAWPALPLCAGTGQGCISHLWVVSFCAAAEWCTEGPSGDQTLSSFTVSESLSKVWSCGQNIRMHHRVISRKVFLEHSRHTELERQLMQNYCCCTSVCSCKWKPSCGQSSVLTHSLALHCLGSWISAVQNGLTRSPATLSGFDF